MQRDGTYLCAAPVFPVDGNILIKFLPTPFRPCIIISRWGGQQPVHCCCILTRIAPMWSHTWCTAMHSWCNAMYNCTHLRCSVALCRGGCTSYRIAVFTKPHCGKVYSVEHMTGITPPARHETQTHTNINTKSVQLDMVDFVFSKVICTLSFLMIFVVIFGIWMQPCNVMYHMILACDCTALTPRVGGYHLRGT